jgi:hypothetical protein
MGKGESELLIQQVTFSSQAGSSSSFKLEIFSFFSINFSEIRTMTGE